MNMSHLGKEKIAPGSTDKGPDCGGNWEVPECTHWSFGNENQVNRAVFDPR